MKSEDKIAARIKELRARLKKQEGNSKAHARETGANRTTLGINVRRKLEGEIAGLEWVLRAEPQMCRSSSVSGFTLPQDPVVHPIRSTEGG